MARLPFRISKRSPPSSLILPLLFLLQVHPLPPPPLSPTFKPIGKRPRRYDAAPIGSPSWTFDRLLQSPNATAGMRVRPNSRGLDELTLARLWTARRCQAVDLPLPAGDTNGLSRLSSFDRRYLSPSSSNSQPICHVTAMNNPEFQLRGISQPRLAVPATNALPAWRSPLDVPRHLFASP